MTYMCKKSIPEELNVWSEGLEPSFKISTYVPSVVVNNYRDFQKILKTEHFKDTGNNWVFRGQSEHSWFLQSTLERIGSKSLELIKKIF